MRIPSAVVLSLALAAACKKAPPPPVPGAPAAATGQAAAANALRGKILETLDASQYTYLRLQTAEGEVWAAVPTTKSAVGTEVAVANPVWMENFKSTTLARTWPKIAFGTLGEGGAMTAQAAAPQIAAAQPGPGMFAQQAAGASAPPMHPAPSAAADLGAIKVAKASGADGRTVSDIYAKKASLKDKKVAVRGKVVKATNGVMGKNWLHLRDGTGEGPTGDLTIASNDTATVGDTVLVTGLVHLDRDLGAGYHYDVLIEEAQIQKE